MHLHTSSQITHYFLQFLLDSFCVFLLMRTVLSDLYIVIIFGLLPDFVIPVVQFVETVPKVQEEFRLNLISEAELFLWRTLQITIFFSWSVKEIRSIWRYSCLNFNNIHYALCKVKTAWLFECFKLKILNISWASKKVYENVIQHPSRYRRFQKSFFIVRNIRKG